MNFSGFSGFGRNPLKEKGALIGLIIPQGPDPGSTHLFYCLLSFHYPLP